MQRAIKTLKKVAETFIVSLIFLDKTSLIQREKLIASKWKKDIFSFNLILELENLMKNNYQTKSNFRQQLLKIFWASIILNVSCCFRLQAQIPTAEINSDHPTASISQDTLKINLSYARQQREYATLVVPKATIFENSSQVLEVKGVESPFPYAMVQIAEMDQSNGTPEIIFQSFSGGAHCCTMPIIVTKQNHQWLCLELGSFDGGLKRISDLNQDGLYEYVTVDNAFLYQFSSYAASVAPPQIWQLQSGKIINATKQPQYRHWLENELNKFWQEAVTEWRESNGFWAGYVAWKALIGEETSAWQLMLKNYDHSETYCTSYDQEYNCIGKEEKFPSALLRFLQENNYLSNDLVLPLK